MIKNISQFIYNVDGSLIDKNLSSIRAHSNHVTIIQMVAPWPSSELITVEYSLRNRESLKLYDYFRVVKNNQGEFLTGKDVISPEKPYFQTAKDWYVWEVSISKRNLSAISKYRSGTVGLVKEKKTLDFIALNLKGIWKFLNH